MLGYYSCLTEFVCSHSVARSVHLLCNAIVNSSWLPRDHVRHVIARHVIARHVIARHVTAIHMLTQHIREILQVTPGPFLDFWLGPGDEARPLLVSCPARARLPVRNGLVNEVEFLGLITQNE